MMLILAAGQLWAADTSLTAREWLEKMSRAAHELDFEGTFVYLHDKQMMAMHIIHAVDERGEHERLVSLTGPDREVVLSKNSKASLLPGTVVTDAGGQTRQSLSEALANDIEQLEKFYDLKLLGKQRVAGRLTQRINVKPKDNFRYGYRLWVDDDSGLLLKADMVNERGVPVEQMMFTEISLHDISVPVAGAVSAQTDSATDADKAGIPFPFSAEQETVQPAMKRAGDEWRITQLPKGFQLTERNKYIMPENHRPVEHLVLTDGLASVSVFIEKFDPDDKFVGTSRRGAVNAYGAVSHEHQITLVGEVPLAAVQLIGQSIKHQSEP